MAYRLLMRAKEVPKYTHQEHLVPVPEPSEAQYHSVPALD